MAAMSDYLESQLRAHVFRTASFTKPTTLAVALYTGAPTDSGGGTEVIGGNYARVALNPLDANWTAVSGTDGLTDNASEITFGTPNANWGEIVAFGIFDATSAGNLLFHGALSVPKTVNNGDPGPKFPVGALSVTFA